MDALLWNILPLLSIYFPFFHVLLDVIHSMQPHDCLMSLDLCQNLFSHPYKTQCGTRRMVS